MSEIYNPHTRTWEYIPSEPTHGLYSGSRGLQTYSPPSPAESESDPYADGLEMRSTRPTTTSSTFGLSTRKPRRSPPRAPFGGSETATHNSHSSEQSCCGSRHTEEHLRTPPKPAPRYDEEGPEMQHSLSPRPNAAKRNSSGSSAGRPVMKNTRTSFTANGDRVEEYSGEGSLRIGTHWVDDQDEVAVEGLGTRPGGRRGSGYGRSLW
ncbi:uncharacterized protein LAJ45_04549 [Morchella importuna]|uniref:Uncharacterized protein n=1 Tax=Morchella conica CCBAS932 TaxID=1392247 RepID=A0A3N4L8H0_9PEZI|nr:uncharacterized protein LAJ45_04549 [Morchella importuna]KAH8151347.1 hypothetical protein LAJ45_04549 [Morchella importuna]RPB14295.1 hypothetical protein P167DRAFT_543839 [Morchella conica CCBAS932]